MLLLSLSRSEDKLDRDYFMTPSEAIEFGLIDSIMDTKKKPVAEEPSQS